MDNKTLMSTFFGFSPATYYSWRRERRPVILFFEKYFQKEELEEFLETGKIKRLDNYYNSLIIFVPADGQLLQFEIKKDEFDVELWQASNIMQRGFSAKREGVLKFKKTTDKDYKYKLDKKLKELIESQPDKKLAFFIK
ncbi:MAG: hypothetical protein RQ763_08025 [Sulfurimonas sp.]|uniref:hypothetical protein n=1 Tax=Sulfurimonas sp. TaxID=2022749 RepID=UPI0028CC9EF5|nr:hypothetical protein [Sulfurimonas sp.]MDT8339132.1 hypothetical protein [Sulfurimonas sp.]